MLAPPKAPKPKAGPVPPPAPDDAKMQKQKAETQEVAGRHKNDGQKDHKGAR
jgi:hypothetical protein